MQINPDGNSIGSFFCLTDDQALEVEALFHSAAALEWRVGDVLKEIASDQENWTEQQVYAALFVAGWSSALTNMKEPDHV